MVRLARRVGALVVAVLALAAASASSVQGRTAAQDADWVVAWQTGQDPDAPVEFEGFARRAEFMISDTRLPMEVSGWAVRATSASDPAGILVMAKRSVRAAPDYHGRLLFTSAASDPRAGRLRVRDGDLVTIVHRVGTPTGTTDSRASGTWRERSARPEWRDLALSNAPAAALGGDGAIAPRAAVRIYSSTSAASPVATGVADDRGAFVVPIPEALAEVWIAAVEPDVSESLRVRVALSEATGTIVLPGTETAPVEAALLNFEEVGCSGAGCTPGGSITGRGGRFSAPTGASHGWRDADYRLSTTLQGVGHYVTDDMWLSSAYGAPDPVPFHKTAGQTADVGAIAVKPPNVLGSVHDDLGLVVPEAQLDLVDAAGEGQPGGGYARRDGAFALFLADGDHRLRVRSTIGCDALEEQIVPIRVRNGVASPSRLDVVLRRGPRSTRQVTVPLPIDRDSSGLVLQASSQPVEVVFEGGEQGSTLTVGCAGVGTSPGITLIDPGVDIDPGALRFAAARVCLTYDDAAVARAGLAETQLEVIHFDGGAPEVQTISRDITANVVCGATTSFSAFALGRMGDVPPSAVPAAPTGSAAAAVAAPGGAGSRRGAAGAVRPSSTRPASDTTSPAIETTSAPVVEADEVAAGGRPAERLAVRSAGDRNSVNPGLILAAALAAAANALVVSARWRLFATVTAWPKRRRET